jgi:hypothetical protein
MEKRRLRICCLWFQCLPPRCFSPARNSLFLYRCPPLTNGLSPSSALLRALVSTSLELSDSQLALFGGSYGPTNLHCKVCYRRENKTRACFRMATLRLSCLSTLQTRITAPFHSQALLIRLRRDARLPVRVGDPLRIQHFEPPIREPSTVDRDTFRLIACVDGCVGCIGGIRQQLVEKPGTRASNFSRSWPNLRQCSNEKNAQYHSHDSRQC